MMNVLYIACSSYSGSTLLSFLLNTHPDIFTIGHLMGWAFDDDEEFYCSCGEQIQECPFFRVAAREFEAAGLPFRFNAFGTRYQIVGNARLNRYLTAALPGCHSSRLEKIRDRLVARISPLAARLARLDRANHTLIKAGLDYSGARVFVENSHSPFRLRHLSRIKGLNIRTVHLVRDFRGVSLSNMNRRGWSPATAARQWFAEQDQIARILPELGDHMTVHYEDLCADTNAELARIHRFAGLEPAAFSGNFKENEHHILGNKMRLNSSTISTDQRWHRDLAPAQRDIIERCVRARLARSGRHRLAEILHRNFTDNRPEPAQ